MIKLSQKLLDSMNLTQSQVAVYIAALELGECNMQELAEKSGVKRTSIYNFIGVLKDRGLIAETKRKKRKCYVAVDPKQLLEAERIRLLELEQVMPDLLAVQNKSDRKPRVTFYEGTKNVLAVYDDQLKEGKPIMAYEDLEFMRRGMPEQFYQSWPAERARRNIPFKSILRDSADAREYVKKNVRLLRESKIIQTEPLKTEINIYGDKVALMRFNDDDALCVLIEDHDIAHTLRVGWQALWDRLEAPKIG